MLRAAAGPATEIGASVFYTAHVSRRPGDSCQVEMHIAPARRQAAGLLEQSKHKGGEKLGTEGGIF